MLKLEKLKLYFEKNLNDLQVLAELRNDLKNIDSNDDLINIIARAKEDKGVVKTKVEK